MSAIRMFMMCVLFVAMVFCIATMLNVPHDNSLNAVNPAGSTYQGDTLASKIFTAGAVVFGLYVLYNVFKPLWSRR